MRTKEFKPISNEMRNELMDLLTVTSSVLNPADLIMVPKLAKKREDKSLLSLSDDEKTANTYSSSRNVFNVDKIFREKSKGILIYRDLYNVKYVFNINETIDDQLQQTEGEQVSRLDLEASSQPVLGENKLQREVSCLAAFYKDPNEYDLINVEVFLKDLKIAISSQVAASEIFEGSNLSFENKIKVLNSLMQRMVIFAERGNYVLKTHPEEPKPTQRQEEAKAYDRRRERIISTLELTEDWREESDKFEKYHVINNSIFKVTAYFLEEPEPESLKPTTGKAVRSQISGQSALNRRAGLTASQIAINNEISGMHLLSSALIPNISLCSTVH